MKKAWKAPTFETLNINQTLADFTGQAQDGTVYHDGQVLTHTTGAHSDSHIFVELR